MTQTSDGRARAREGYGNHWNCENAARLVAQRESGMTFKAIGELWGVSTERARQVYLKELRLRKRLSAGEDRKDGATWLRLG